MKKPNLKFLISNFLFLTVLCTASAETLVGELPGDVDVDSTGEASYSIPLSLPPGTAGVQPSLAIRYSSQGGNGVMGLGFSLGGLSAISRAPAMRLQDGTMDGIDFDALDRLVLDGQRLMVTPTNAAYGADGTQYRTEIDSFSRIILHGGMNSPGAWFEVHTKSGLIYEYGHTSDSFAEPEGQSAALTWAVNKISDTSGNYMTFHYSENIYEPQLLTAITYTGNDGQNMTPCNAVEFVYEARNDSRPGYLAGSRLYFTRRLQKIVAKGSGETVSDCRLTYEYNSAGLSVLTSVQQFFANGDSLPVTVFSYGTNAVSGPFQIIEPTGHEPGSTLGGDSYQQWLRSGEGTNGGVNIIPGDYNGDGKMDFIRQEKDAWDEDTTDSFAVYFSRGNGYFNVVYPTGGSDLRFDPGVNIIPGDYNGDGLTDFIRQEKGGWDENDDGSFSVYFSRGDGDFDIVYRSDSIYQTTLRDDPGANLITGDYNGDGRTDFLMQEKNGNAFDMISSFAVYFSKGDGTFDYVFPGNNNTPYDPYQDLLRFNDKANGGANIIPGDYNGDGLTDFIRQEKGSWASNSFGSFAVYFSKGDGTFDIVYPGQNAANDPYQDWLRSGDGPNGGVNIIPGDYNGDGLTDFIRQEKGSWASNFSGSFAVYFSKGDGTFDIVYPGQNAANDPYQGWLRSGDGTNGGVNIIPGDYNGDGLTDFLRQENGFWASNDNICTFAVYYSGGDGTFRVEFPGQNADGDPYQHDLRDCGSYGASIIPGDYNGDGVLDFIRQEFGSWANDTDGSFRVYFANNRGGNLLTEVKEGFRSGSQYNSSTEIQYRPITDTNIYVKGSGAVYPVADVQYSMVVVSSLVKDNGVGGKYYSDYTYANARSHRDRGFLGFQIFESYDRQTHLSQVEILAHDFPFTGSQLSSETYYSPDPVNNPTNVQRLKEVRNTYLYDTIQNGTIFPYVAKSVEKKWELGETDTNHTISVATAYNWFDQQTLTGLPVLTQPSNAPRNIVYGNITKIVMDYGDGTRQISSNQYYSVNTNTWLLGRLATASITHELSGKPAITKTSAFSYDVNTGLLLEEKIAPGHATLELTTDYQYDGFGNITNKVVSAPGIAARAVQQNDYASGGRFVSVSRNILNHGETYQYDQKTGLVLSKTGPNGLTTSMQYDSLGRAIQENRADGTFSTTEYIWDTSVTVSVPLAPTGASVVQTSAWKVVTQSSGTPPVTVWYDRQGREIRRKALSPSGTQSVYQDTGYNGLGQNAAVSESYFAGETPVYSFSAYDALGRTAYVTAPDGTVMETVYNGLTTQSIADSNRRSGSGADAPKHQVKTVVQNAKGQTLEVIDNLNNSLLYEYDAAGNLTATVAGAGGPGAVRIEMVYDIRGNKIQQTDPDMGTWNYTYNALGELVSQTDAKGQTTVMEYDTLGRMIKRTTSDGEARWFYDGTDEGCRLGTLRREELRDAQGNLTYRKTYAYDTLGRPMLELYNFDNKWYYTCYRYDEYSRLKFTDRFWRPKAVAESGDNLSPVWNVFGTVNTYSQQGILTGISDSTGHTWWEMNPEDVDAEGRLLKYTLGNGTVTEKSYNPLSGFLTQISCRNGASQGVDIQNDLYSFDRLGNLASRRNLRQVLLKEEFVYDGLNRLTQSTVESSFTNSPLATSCAYGAQGNILSKTDAGTYLYGSSKPHAVTSVTDPESRTTSCTYDQNGNMAGRAVDGTNTLTTLWTSFNMVKSMYSGQNGSRFTYDINNSRILHISETVTDTTNTVKKKIYIAGMEQDEEVTNPTNAPASWTWAHKETRIFINTPSGTVGIHVQTPGSTPSAPDSIARKYFHTDHLGSITAVSGELGAGSVAPLLAEYSFDAWGARRNAVDWSPLATCPSSLATDRGFTVHEHLDHLGGLVHMNGRIYDPHLGRFLSADPTIQFPGDMQDYNRYSYVGNNPLKYTDPSGYGWFSKIWKSVRNFVSKYWKTIVVIVVAVVVTWLTWGLLSGPCASLFGSTWGAVAAGAVAGAAGGFAAGMVGTRLNGGSWSDAWKAGLEGAAWGAVAGAAGGYVQALKWGTLCTALAHGVTGSAISFAQGDSIESGFLAGLGGGAISGYMGGMNFAYKAFAAAIVGGCASMVGGGKFESGAVTGAFTSLAWAAVSNADFRQKVWGGIKTAAGKTWEFVRDNLFGTPQEQATMDWSLSSNFKAYNYGGSGRTNGLDMRQTGLSPRDIGPGPNNNNPQPMNAQDGGRGFGGYLAHDRRFAAIESGGILGSLQGVCKAGCDALLIVDSALAIVPIGNSSPVLPSLMTAGGMTVAAPLHAFNINP